MSPRDLIEGAVAKGRSWLLEPEAKELCRLIGLATPRFKVALSLREALEAAEEIGYPVVMKVVSPDIIHKAELGGVLLGLASRRSVEEAYVKLVEGVKASLPRAEVLGVMVEEEVRPGLEVAFGFLRDPQFGPAVMFGLGGAMLELYRDVAFKLAPLSYEEARELIAETKVGRLIEGFKGGPRRDVGALIDVALKLSKLGVEEELIELVDLNPVVVYERGAVVVDAKVAIKASRGSASSTLSAGR
ncbi:MAG: acetate--CoA ligase family protein [Candidatus Nezhaarchaeota archaeon]|nr:acetate--CoA ligase family protein [Candidatus Nezhaarchaeota archaeon]